MAGDSDSMLDARRRAWSGYWTTGALHSCAGSFDGNYGGAIGAFWDARVDALAEGARVLDLATGNGALPRRVVERAGGRGLQVDGVDLAAIAPRWHDPAAQPGVRFHAGVSLDRLPFPDATFELVASQYGIEYAPLPASLEEALRVLVPGGTLALVMHHAGSVLATVGRAELGHLERLLDPGGLVDAAAQVAPWLSRARAGTAPDAAGVAARERYNAAVAAIGSAIERSPAPDLLVEAREQVHGLVAGVTTATLDDTLAALARYRDALAAARLRTGEMVAHALDAAAIEALASRVRMARPSATVHVDTLSQREGVLAWTLVATG